MSRLFILKEVYAEPFLNDRLFETLLGGSLFRADFTFDEFDFFVERVGVMPIYAYLPPQFFLLTLLQKHDNIS